MDSRRHDELGSHKRLRDHEGIVLSREHHLTASYHDILDRSLKRPFNPGTGSMRGDKRSSSMERRSYGWGRHEIGRSRSRSRSPRFRQVHERLNNSDGPSSRYEMRRKYDFCNYMDKLDDVDTNMKCHYGNKNSRFSGNIWKDIAGDRILIDGMEHDYSRRKSMVQEDSTGQVRYRFPGGPRPTTNYCDYSQCLESASMNVDIGRSLTGEVKYPNSILLDKLSAFERYEKPEPSSRHMSHYGDMIFPSRDFSDRSQLKEFGSMTEGLSGSFLGSCEDAMSFARDIYPASSTKAMKSFSSNEYGQKQTSETHRAPDPCHTSLVGYQQDTYCSSRADLDDALYARHRLSEGEHYDYASDGINRVRLLYEGNSCDPRDMQAHNTKEPILKHTDNPEHSLRKFDESTQELSSLCNYFASESSDASRLLYKSKHSDRYHDSGSPCADFEKEALREQNMSSLDNSRDNDISKTQLNCDFEVFDDSLAIRERMRNSSDRQYNKERLQLSTGREGIRLDHIGNYDPLNQSYKKYDVDEELRRHDFRTAGTSKWNWSSLDRMDDLTYRDERYDERYNEYADDLLFSRTMENDTGGCTREGRNLFNAERVSTPEDWSSLHDSEEHREEYFIERFKSGRKKPKRRVGSGSLNLYSSKLTDKKHYPSENVWVRGKDDHAKNVWARRKDVDAKNVWVRGRDDVKLDIHESTVEKTENLSAFAKPEPSENSEEFKQLVQRFFLSYTKKINDNPNARKRYKELGRAGGLFCIVCSRSQSKEFTDTQRLLAHCYMSRKFGLRAQHLGLHKAICVLMGWDTKTASNVPKVVSSSEASACKHDLILWPPVVIIHNITTLCNSSAAKEEINVKALENFLRGKGFSGGQMKVCLGNPGNNTIMVVKFLNTLTGLRDADRLNKYFTENKHGRSDFEKLASAEGKSIHNHDARRQEVKFDELFLYGYVAIAEDLDKVDLDTKRKCSIRSFKEIHDIANDPVRVERS